MPSQRKHPPYEYLTSRWGGMEIREEYGCKIEKWLSVFEEKDRPLLLDLLGSFQFYSDKRIGSKVTELFQLFKASCSTDIADTVFIKPLKDFGTSFSSIFFTSFWLNNNLYDYVEESITDLLSEDIIPSVIAIVDDYSGSGKTVIKTIKKIIGANPSAAQTRFYILVLMMSETAEKNITKYADKSNLIVQIITLDKTPGAFEAGFVFDENLVEDKKAQYSELYDRLLLNPAFKFGFSGIASLVAFHYNTPNDTLGLFWQDLSEFCALFPRHKPAQTLLHQMQTDARDRRRRRRNVTIYGIDEGRRSAMMVYCVTQEKGVTLWEMKKEFGVTDQQLDADIKSMLEKGYLKYKDNQFFPTEKLKSHMFMSRLEKVKKETEKLPHEKSPFSPHEEYIPLNFD